MTAERQSFFGQRITGMVLFFFAVVFENQVPLFWDPVERTTLNTLQSGLAIVPLEQGDNETLFFFSLGCARRFFFCLAPAGV